MYHAGLIPEKTADPTEALLLWNRDGAAILTTDRTDPEGMLAGARSVFGDRLSAHQGFTKVASYEKPGQGTYFDSPTRTVHADAGVRLELHIDGMPRLSAVLTRRPA